MSILGTKIILVCKCEEQETCWTNMKGNTTAPRLENPRIHNGMLLTNWRIWGSSNTSAGGKGLMEVWVQEMDIMFSDKANLLKPIWLTWFPHQCPNQWDSDLSQYFHPCYVKTYCPRSDVKTTKFGLGNAHLTSFAVSWITCTIILIGPSD